MSRSTAAERLARVRCVFFDFDGPICPLFIGRRELTDGAAHHIKTLLWQAGLGVPGLEESQDPHHVLRVAGKTVAELGLPEALRVAERHLAEVEAKAAERAGAPTPHVADLLDHLRGQDIWLAVTSNNDAEAIRSYLKRTDLEPYFDERIFGRHSHPARMKPHPHCLQEAVRESGREPDECLLLGDSVSDGKAAAKLGVAFVGYANRPEKQAPLRDAGALAVVDDLRDLLLLLRPKDVTNT
jgi:HAD superfamily hydrolase (TIGR01509 family)